MLGSVGWVLTYMRDYLVSNGTIVLENVVVCSTRGFDQLLGDGLRFSEQQSVLWPLGPETRH